MTYRRFVHDQVPPDPPDVYELAAFPVAVVPYALGALESRIPAFVWADGSYLRGNQLIRGLQMALLNGGMQELIEGQNRIYRLIDSAMYGHTYTVETDEPLVIVPEIPAVPDQTLEPAGLLGMVDSLPGILDAGWFGIGGHKATIADVVNALRVGNSQTGESVVSQLEGILGAGGNVAQIGELVAEMFTGSVSAVEEGGIFVLLAAGIVGNLATTGAIGTQLTAMALQLTRLIHAIDGGGLLPPGDNILEALRGDTEAGADRNVIDSLGTVAGKLDELIADLEHEHGDNTAIIAKLEAIRTQLL